LEPAVPAVSGWRLLARAVWTHARGAGLLWGLSHVVGGLLPALQVALTAALLDRLLQGAGRGPAALPALLPVAAALTAAMLVGQGLFTVWPACKQLCAIGLQRGLDGQLLERLASTGLAEREDPRVDALLQRAGAPGAVAADLLELCLNALMDGATIISLGLVLGLVRWWLPAGLLAGALPLVAASAHGAGARRTLELDQAADRRLADHLSDLATERAAAPEVRLFGLADHLIGRWHVLALRLARERAALVVRESAATVPARLLPRLLTFGGIALLIWLARGGGLATGRAVALIGGVIALESTLSGVAGRAAGLREGFDRLADAARLLALPAGPARDGGMPPPRPWREGIGLEGVTFRYPGAGRPALDGLTLRIRAGEHLALVGPNGAGKSTLVKCLLGLYRPEAGRITVDGIDLRAIAPQLWRRAVTPVFQDHLRPEFTVREAIAPGCPDAGPDRLRRAAAAAGAATFIEALPEAYDSPLGRSLHDDGVEPSGGQWQRLALARGLLPEPELLILDEPAAAQDPRAEAALYGRLREIAAGRTVLLISHRLGSARLADRIAVIDGGRVVELGSHDALLARGGAYAGMWAAQAAWYGDDPRGPGQHTPPEG